MQIEGHQRVAGALHLADQLADFLRVQQQLARAHRVGMNVGRGRKQRRDVGADEEYLAALEHHVGFLDLRAPGPDRLHFPAFEDQAGLVALFYEVIVECLLVVGDAHGAAR